MDAITAHAVCREVRLPKNIEQVAGLVLLLKLDATESYRVLDHAGKLLRNVDSRTAQILIMRGLISGDVRSDGKVSNLRLAPGRTALEIKKAMQLKPAAVSIANRATVVKVLPTTWTHRASLRAGL